MPNDFWDDALRAWRGWSPLHDIVHPDAPAGGAGPGSFDTFAQIGHDTPPPGMPHPDSPAGKSVETFTLRSVMSRKQAESLLDRVKHAPFSELPSQPEMLILRGSFGLGVATAILKSLKNMVVSTAYLIFNLEEVGRTFVLADFYDQATEPGYRQCLSFYQSPTIFIGVMIWVRFLGIDFLKKAAERRAALIKEMQWVFDHKLEILKSIPAKVRDEYVKKWNRLLDLKWTTNSLSLINYKSAFEAGEIFGEVLVDVVTIIYAVRGVLKLITEIPELWALATKSLGKLGEEVAVVTEEVLPEVGEEGIAETRGPVAENPVTEPTDPVSEAAAKPPKPTVSKQMREKILNGEPKPKNPKEIRGGHSAKIRSDPEYQVQEISKNPDGTSVVKYKKRLSDGSMSKPKKSTLAPESWNDEKIIEVTDDVADSPPVATSPGGSTLHRGTVDGVQWEVIKDSSGEITSSYPTGGNPTKADGVNWK